MKYKQLKLQGDFYPVSKLVDNLISYYNIDPDNEEGLRWYSDAREFCIDTAKKYGVHYGKVAGILSALSPLKNWEENKRITIEFLNGKRNMHFRGQVQKAEKIMQLSDSLFVKFSDNVQDICSILRGSKTVSFFLNITTNVEAVTVDRHIISAATGYEYRVGLTVNQYAILQLACFMACERVNWGRKNEIEDKQFQAIVWCNYKKQFEANLAPF